MRTERNESLDGYRARPQPEQLRTELQEMGFDAGLVSILELGEDARSFVTETPLGRELHSRANARLADALRTLIHQEIGSQDFANAQVTARAMLAFFGMLEGVINEGAQAASRMMEAEETDG